MAGEKYPGWLIWIWDKGFLAVIFVALALALVILVPLVYFENRLDTIEEQLTYEPPGQYQPPDLDAFAAEGVDAESLSVEQAVYVPVYSHVYAQGGRPFLLEATLSIRNTDMHNPIFIRSVNYYDTNGELSRCYDDRLLRLDPLASIDFLVPQRDTVGGSGANFIVEWSAQQPVDEPIIETVMVGIAGTQGICFSRAGQPLRSRPADTQP